MLKLFDSAASKRYVANLQLVGLDENVRNAKSFGYNMKQWPSVENRHIYLIERLGVYTNHLENSYLHVDVCIENRMNN